MVNHAGCIWQAGEWASTRDAYINSQRISGDHTPSASLEARASHSVLGGAIDRSFQGGVAPVSSKLAVVSLQEQLLELQHQLSVMLLHCTNEQIVTVLH